MFNDAVPEAASTAVKTANGCFLNWLTNINYIFKNQLIWYHLEKSVAASCSISGSHKTKYNTNRKLNFCRLAMPICFYMLYFSVAYIYASNLPHFSANRLLFLHIIISFVTYFILVWWISDGCKTRKTKKGCKKMCNSLIWLFCKKQKQRFF